MYESLKSILKTVIPNSFLHKNEAFLRRMIAARYKGDKYQCNICQFKLKDWVHLDRGDLLCPNCGSLGRTRRLFSIIGDIDLSNKSLLHFSPPKPLRKYFELLKDLEYITTDFESEFEADQSYDITKLDVEDSSFDIVICYHVLEHITEDHKAMSELYRILKKGGVLIIQTPFHQLPTAEDPKINTPELRLEHYGQSDHVRIYNAENLSLRLSRAGLSVKSLEFSEKKENQFGFKTKEIVLVCEK